MIAAMRSVVATGRRMKMREGLIAGRPDRSGSGGGASLAAVGLAGVALAAVGLAGAGRVVIGLLAVPVLPVPARMLPVRAPRLRRRLGGRRARDLRHHLHPVLEP